MLRGFRFGVNEIRDIVISAIVLAYAFGGLDGFWVALFAVGISFLSHELIGHKLVAQHFGFFAEYRKWTFGLALAIFSSFFGMVFAAPGAVYIAPTVREGFAWKVREITKKEMGIVGLGGPFVNIVLGAAFVGGIFLLPQYLDLFFLTARISFFLALFNLLPFHPLDGGKVIDWSKTVWAVSIGLAVAGYLGLQFLVM